MLTPLCGDTFGMSSRMEGYSQSAKAAALKSCMLTCCPACSFIEWCRAGTELEVLVPGGQPCIHLSLQVCRRCPKHALSAAAWVRSAPWVS